MRIPNRYNLVLSGLALATVAAENICGSDPSDVIPDGCTSYSTLEELNENLRPLVQSLTTTTDYFSYYRLDLYGRTCPFWNDGQGMCSNIACAVTTIDNEEDIPTLWRAEELSKLTGPQASHPKGKKATESPLGGQLGMDTEESCVVEEDECDDRDYCVPEDETGKTGVYVSLLENPERFTGYAGQGSENVWKSIYRENCFSRPKTGSAPVSSSTQGFTGLKQDKLGLKTGALQQPPRELEVDDGCLEKRVFYRVISGMHSSISVHLCWDYLNQTTGQWQPNLDCFVNRFKGYPERIQNIYFNYAILLRAISKLKNFFPQYTFCSGDPMQNRLTKSKVLQLINAVPANSQPIFDEAALFQDDAIDLKNEFRNRFRNVSRVMDCVGCDKCRLWGKVQTQGYGTALKILFEFDENADISENPPLHRTELVALINTFDRVSHALSVLPKFHELWQYQNETEARGAPLPPAEPKKPHPSFHQHFMAEWNAVWATFFFVIKSWFYLPWILFRLFIEYASMVWDRLIGRFPISPQRTEL